MKRWDTLSVDEKRAMIAKVYGDDGGSASEIAARISHETGFRISRGAVTGFYNRQRDLRVSYPLTGARIGEAISRTARTLPASPARRTVRKTTRLGPPLEREVKPAPKKATLSEEAAMRDRYDASAPRLSILEIGNGQCRYAVTDDRPHLFCGHETERGSSWCDHHRERVFRPASESLLKG